MNTSYSTQDNDNSILSIKSICDYSSEVNVIDGIINILNLLIKQNKNLKNYLKLEKKTRKKYFFSSINSNNLIKRLFRKNKKIFTS